MKRSRQILSMLLVLALLAITVFAIASCGETPDPGCTEHTDKNCDNKCDTCQADVQIGHVDKNDDGVCDKCRKCVTHVDATCNGECDNCYEEVPVVHIDEDEDNKCDRCGKRVTPLKINAVKTSSVPAGMTVNGSTYIAWNDTTIEGDTVTFTISVTNEGSAEITAVIIDTVPENTTYISGCDNKVP